MFAVGVLAFLFVDVFEHAFAIVEDRVVGFKDDKNGVLEPIGLALLLAAGFATGTVGLAMFERRMRPKDVVPPMAGAAGDTLTVEDHRLLEDHRRGVRSARLRTGMTIAAAIGLHNFAEGLAIGVAANAGEIGLATVLIIGFALHNTTEGFGIVGPLGDVRPSWRWLGAAGLIGGGPTFLGSMIGYQVSSDALALVFYAVAGGAILYVVVEIWHAMRRFGHREVGLWMLTAGFMIGLITDMVVVYGGG
ncbi:zinc permease [Baekduia soli]|uniref:Zinc permease n=2 Tax=Baekduia soli TaxID=496014 RepID=A0A5B8U9B0_9ACTN|nr:zinc permease [Baekduia soli]